MTSRKLTFSLFAICAIAILALSFSYPVRKEQKPAGFKNLKILPKDISKEKLDSTMSYYCVSLGVHCGFCHARSSDTTSKRLDFASDAKEEKGIARSMMKMTYNINTVYFDFKKSAHPDTLHTVTCFTCHRGKADPMASNLVPEYNSLKEQMMKKR